MIELVDAHALVVAAHHFETSAVDAERLQRGEVRRFLDHHHVAGIDQRLSGEVDALLRSGGDQDLFGVRRQTALREPLGDPGAQRAETRALVTFQHLC